ncbi:MAG TPA: peroxide stress protein YaaA [Bacteroidetes bacterium]|nr:peroxide stress protein YaaA [Bacteroidota bacterium]
MKTVALISCVSKKLNKKAKAEDLYLSPLFKKNMAYSKKINVDEIYILSAKYGLLKLDDEIEPYDLTLNKMKVQQKKEWSQMVLEQLQKLEDLDNTNFIFLAGENYRKYLIENIPHYEVPMKGLKIGKQLQFLTKNLK